MTFRQKLDAIVAKNNSLLCIGLDSDIDKIPERIRNGPHPQTTFNKAIIYATQDLVCAYKLNTAFYEARGVAGVEAMKMTCDYLKAHYPDVVIIIDAKRADIGNTNVGYAKFVFDYLGGDAVTLQPYLGGEALKPFLDQKEKGILILCRTSNPGAGEFQDLMVKGKPLYQIVAENFSKNWNANGNCGLVVGATYPTELSIVRRIAGDMPILIPGVGTQGGDAKKTVKAGVDRHGRNAIINSSRGILFASTGADFAQKAREEALKLRDQINQYR
ncbi:MAG TPA: orotidine-5'-phosphate decarboxylase [Patescibacteria group bacterium]|nr:orotidine-5'-phosphate decarboxylase [Patescibacteria group bacterium]